MNAKQQEFKRNVNILESLAAGSDCEDADEKRRLLNTCAAKMREAAQGHARYEALRCLNPRDYTEMWRRNLAGDARFDDMVDELLKAKNES